MTEQNYYRGDDAEIHFERLKFLISGVNSPGMSVPEFNTEASNHIKKISDGTDGLRGYIGFYFYQRVVPDWDRERPSDYLRQLHYYKFGTSSSEFVNRIPLASMMRRLERVEACPVKLGRAVAYFFNPESEGLPNAILSSPRRINETPAVPNMTLYRSLL